MPRIRNRSDYCKKDHCVKRASFGILGEKKGIYCAEHKKSGMVNVKDPTCQEEGCLKIPNYHNQGEKKGIYCVKHKKPGMVDVKNPTSYFP